LTDRDLSIPQKIWVEQMNQQDQNINILRFNETQGTFDKTYPDINLSQKRNISIHVGKDLKVNRLINHFTILLFKKRVGMNNVVPVSAPM
jgi:hypothetical protein